MSVRIGEVMVEHGLLTEGQVEQILEIQRDRARPFGQLAEELFGVSEEHVEHAWVMQYARLTEHVDPWGREPDPGVRSIVERRQAWQFQVFPVRFDGAELMVATTRQNLARALRFASRCLNVPCFLVLSEEDLLTSMLRAHYPMGGLDGTLPDGLLSAA